MGNCSSRQGSACTTCNPSVSIPFKTHLSMPVFPCDVVCLRQDCSGSRFLVSAGREFQALLPGVIVCNLLLVFSSSFQLTKSICRVIDKANEVGSWRGSKGIWMGCESKHSSLQYIFPLSLGLPVFVRSWNQTGLERITNII